MTVVCELCRRAELTPGKRLREDLLTLVGFQRRPSFAEIMHHSMEGFMRTAMGGTITPYERHKDAYVRTGDLDELSRMLRHVV